MKNRMKGLIVRKETSMGIVPDVTSDDWRVGDVNGVLSWVKGVKIGLVLLVILILYIMLR